MSNCSIDQILMTNDEDVNTLYTSYMTSKFFESFFKILPLLGIIANIFIIIFYLKCSKGGLNSNTSMKKMFFIAAIIQLNLCVYWEINGFVFKSVNNMKSNCTFCTVNGYIWVYLECVQQLFMTFILHNLRTILVDPISGIMKFKKRFIIYMILTLMCPGIILGVAAIGGIIGISPMLTCAVINYSNYINFTFPLIVYLAYPVFANGYRIFLSISIFRNKIVSRKFKAQKFFIKYVILIFIYSIFKIPLTVLYVYTWGKRISPNSFESTISVVAAISSISIDLILCIITFFFGHAEYIDLDKKGDHKDILLKKEIQEEDIELQRPKSDSLQRADSYFSTRKSTVIQRATLTFANLESDVMEKFMRDIFIGICHSLTTNKGIIHKNEFLGSEFEYEQKFKIKKNHISFIDPTLKKVEKISIFFSSFAPYVFRSIFNSHGVSEEDLIDSLLPGHNQVGIKESQGKSGSFFINTDDGKLILKTVTDEEFHIILNKFLKKYYNFNKNNDKSILVPIFGLYQISLIEKNINIILMPNIKGQLANNITCGYDLKGSTLDREIQINIDRIDNDIMKDNNFEEIEKYLFLYPEDSLKLNQIVNKASNFLCDLELMDYSLLVFKITLNSHEINQIFPKNGKIVREFLPLKNYLFRSLQPNSGYIIAIIDYLQIYNFFKFIETSLKFHLKSKVDKVTEISCVPPNLYSERFISFVRKITDVDIKYLLDFREKDSDSDSGNSDSKDEKK